MTIRLLFISLKSCTPIAKIQGLEHWHHQQNLSCPFVINQSPFPKQPQPTTSLFLWIYCFQTFDINEIRQYVVCLGFPGGSEVKASACNAGDLGSIPGLGRSPGVRNGNPFQSMFLVSFTQKGVCDTHPCSNIFIKNILHLMVGNVPVQRNITFFFTFKVKRLDYFHILIIIKKCRYGYLCESHCEDIYILS